jgi:uncharacterized protein YkwD
MLRRTVTLLVGFVTLLGLAPLALAPEAHAAADPRAQLLELVNAARFWNGAAPLSLDPALSASSCSWNEHLIAQGNLTHDPNLAAAGALEPGWRILGENLGLGPDVTAIFDAYVASPAHFANMIDRRFSRIGICVATAPDGTVFTTNRFVGFRQSVSRNSRRSWLGR